MAANADQNMHERAVPVLYSRAAVVDGSVSEEDRTVEFIASTDDVDGHGTILRQNWRLDRFAGTGGPVLYAHDHSDIPIGTATARVDGGRLRALVKFSTEDLNPKAEQVFRNVKAGVIRGISVGFAPHAHGFEKRESGDVLILDDNELFELSVTPVPSNAAAIAQLRSMHAPAVAPDPITTPELDVPATNPHVAEVNDMSEQNDNGVTVAVSRALQLPIGSTDNDVLARIADLRELEAAAFAVTGASSAAEAIGAMRAAKEGADRLKATEERLVKVERERDQQNFESLVNQALNERKMTPAEAAQKREEFSQDVSEGRGSVAVDRLRGWVKVAAPRVSVEARRQPSSVVREALSWNGKSYADLKPMERARLAKEEPELFAAMREGSV
jgi:HK97 family phage prohead protease